MTEKIKKIIIWVVVVLILIAGFIVFRNRGDDGDFLTTSGGSEDEIVSGANVIGTEIIEALNQIDALKLDTSIFDDPVFTRLRDKSQPIPPEPVGRDNPFAPLESVPNGSTDNLDIEDETEAPAEEEAAPSGS